MAVSNLIIVVFLLGSGWATSNTNETHNQCEFDYLSLPFPPNFTLPVDLLIPAKAEQVQVPDKRIINGLDAEENQFPYQVRLRTFGAYGASTCGGVIINENSVLTAGHCVDPKSYVMYVMIQYGSNYVQNMTLFNTSRIFVHPKFNIRTIANDIAVIKLPCSKRFEFSASVKAIALPWDFLCEDWVGSKGIVSGFGLYNSVNNTLLLSPRLKYVTLKVIPNIECFRYYGILVRPENICAVGTSSELHQGDCRGDSGGPFAITVHNQLVLVGLVSFGHQSCLKYPNVYTRVAPHMKWINSIISDWQ